MAFSLFPLRKTPMLFCAALLSGCHHTTPPATNPIPAHSSRKAQPALLFNISNGSYATILLGNKTYPAFIDTGSTVTRLPARLNINLTKTGAVESADYFTQSSVNLEAAQIPSIRIGNSEARNIKALLIPSDFPPPVQGAEGTVTIKNGDIERSVPILGWSALGEGAITLDWQRKEMIVYPADYDFTQKKRRPIDMVLNLCSGPNDLPLVEGSVQGHSTRFLIDTGVCYDGIIINAQNQFKLLPNQRAPRGYVQWSVGGSQDKNGLKEKTSYAVLFAHDDRFLRERGVGVNIGSWLLKRYRVTIDRKRGKLLLEPFARPKP